MMNIQIDVLKYRILIAHTYVEFGFHSEKIIDFLNQLNKQKRSVVNLWSGNI